MQRRIQTSIQTSKMKSFDGNSQRLKEVSYFRRMLHVRRLTGL